MLHLVASCCGNGRPLTRNVLRWYGSRRRSMRLVVASNEKTREGFLLRQQRYQLVSLLRSAAIPASLPILLRRRTVNKRRAAACCALLRLTARCCALLRLVAPYCALLHIVAPCCTLLHLIVPCCALLRLVSPCCALLRLVAPGSTVLSAHKLTDRLICLLRLLQLVAACCCFSIFIVAACCGLLRLIAGPNAQELKLGELVAAKYGTDFYMLDRYVHIQYLFSYIY